MRRLLQQLAAFQRVMAPSARMSTQMIRLQPNGREVLAGETTIALPFTISEAWWDSNRGIVVALMAFHENTSTKRFENLVAYNVAVGVTRSRGRVDYAAALRSNSAGLI
jgi:hypothetical protein